MHIEQLVKAYARLCEREEDITHAHTHVDIVDYYQDIIQNWSSTLPGEKDRAAVMAKAMGQRMWKLARRRLFKYYQMNPDWCIRRVGRSSYSELDELRELQNALVGRYSKLRGKVEYAAEFETLDKAYRNRMAVLIHIGMMEDDKAEFMLLSDLLGEKLELVRTDLQEPATTSLYPVINRPIDSTPVLFLPKKKNKVYSTKGTVGPQKYRTPSQTSARGQKNTAISPDRLIAEQREYVSD